MFRHATIAALLTLTLTPACDERDDRHDAGDASDTDDTSDTGDTEAVDSETDGEDSEGASETGAPVETEGSSESSGEPPGGGGDSITPLVLAFAGEAVQFNTAVAAGFDLTGTMSVVTDWPTSTTPWLALDRNGNGKVDDGGELFGSATLLRSGETAANGFIALAEMDSNLDGRVDARDEQWDRVLVWSDVDGDRKSTANELQTARLRDLVAVELEYAVDRRCDARGNCEVERARFVYQDGSGRELFGAVIDVHLRLR